MRKLGLRDAFALARIIKAAGIRKEILEFAERIKAEQKERQKLKTLMQKPTDEEQQEENDEYIEKVGFEFFIVLIEAVCDSESEQRIYKLYADIKGVTPEEVSLLDFGTIKADMKELVEKNDLKGFFTSVSALMSKQSGFSSVTAAAI